MGKLQVRIEFIYKLQSPLAQVIGHDFHCTLQDKKKPYR